MTELGERVMRDFIIDFGDSIPMVNISLFDDYNS